MEYVSAAEIAEQWNISKRRVQVLCSQGRISNAKRIGNMWVVPTGLEKPTDARVKQVVLATNFDKNTIKARQDLKKCIYSIVQQTRDQYTSIKQLRVDITASLAIELFRQFIPNSIECGKLVKIQLDYSNCPAVKLMRHGFSALSQKYYLNSENFLSWTYQYLNDVIDSNIFSDTQFFTEKYMINSIITDLAVASNDTIFDPACGGGNFLVFALEHCFNNGKTKSKEELKILVSKLYGYDLDYLLARIAYLNIQLKVCTLIHNLNDSIEFKFLENVQPHIYYSINDNKIGSLDIYEHKIVECISNNVLTFKNIFDIASVIVTNPPFITIKGMDIELREYLKRNFENCKCDVCNAFMKHILSKSNNSRIGMVVQNTWMFLSSFVEFRRQFLNESSIESIVDLGTNSFYDLSGEKANVSLIVFKQKTNSDNNIKIINIRSFKLKEKEELLLAERKKNSIAQFFPQSSFLANKDCSIDYLTSSEIKQTTKEVVTYNEFAIPMQGTSTGNSAELLDFFWNRFNDKEWKLVSKGGGYCRWAGLNLYKIKWGEAGEFILNTKGSAMRNLIHFKNTQLVFSDTGTSGLNVRIIAPTDIFVASGPGIRIKKGKMFAHLAFLNSRIASYFIRCSTPKLTIAAGYIGKLPVTEILLNSKELNKLGKDCVEIKRRFNSKRPNYFEYNFGYESVNNLYEMVQNQFIEELEEECRKLKNECLIEKIVTSSYGISDTELRRIEYEIGCCAYKIADSLKMSIHQLDEIFASLLNDSCELSRTRTSNKKLGCDGVLEYVSIQYNISPQLLIKFIKKNVNLLTKTVHKYYDMLLHNCILFTMNYNSQIGIDKSVIYTLDYIIHKISCLGINDTNSIEQWLNDKFNIIHMGIFKKAPFLKYDKEGKRFLIKGDTQWI